MVTGILGRNDHGHYRMPLPLNIMAMGRHVVIECDRSLSMGTDMMKLERLSLDDRSLYCTEVLPVATPPSQPITVEGGGSSGCGLVSINGGASVNHSQPLQYTIVLAEPHHHQQLQQQQQQHSFLGNGTRNAVVSPTSLPSISNSTAAQQHQQQQQLRFPGVVRGVGQAAELVGKTVPASAQPNGVNGLVISSSGNLATERSGRTASISTALVAYPVTLTGANSQTLLVNNTFENGGCGNRASEPKLTVNGANGVHQELYPTVASAAVGSFGHDAPINPPPPPQLRLVPLPEAGQGASTAAPGFLLLTYAPAGSGNVKGVGSVAVADIASISQIQGLNASNSHSLRFEPQHQTPAINTSNTTSERSEKSKAGLCNANPVTPATSSLASVRLAEVEHESSSALGQENNLSNHIRVLSASARGIFSSSLASSVVVTSCLPPEVTRSTAPVLSSSCGVWTSLVRSSSPAERQPSPKPTDHYQRKFQGSRGSPPPLSPLQRQGLKQQHYLEPRHSPDAASNGAPEGMHSGRVGQSGSGPHPNSSNISNNNSSSSNNSINSGSSSINNPHLRPNSPVDRGPSGNPSKPTGAVSPTSSVGSSSSPPPHHLQHLQQQQHRLPQPHTTSLGMLSAGTPSIPAGIFRTGGDSPSASSRLPGSGGGSSSSTSYSPSPYSSLYGSLHQQAAQSTAAHTHHAAHLQGLAPYHTFFPSSAAAASSLHGFGSAGGLMIPPPTASPGGGAASAGGSHHYPRIESYSAVLASMGSQALQASSGSTLDRSVRGPVSGGMALPSAPGRGSYLPMSAARTGHGFLPGGGITSGLPSPCSASSPPSSGVHRRLSGGSGSPSPGHMTSNNNSGVVPGSRLSPLDKMAAMKAGGGAGVGRDSSNRLALDLSEERGSRRSPPSTHAPKVSFDFVVKEYGGGEGGGAGGSDSPPTPGYLRAATLSGKEGSLKHRILTRPSDSEPASGEDSPGGDREQRRPGHHQLLRDEPAHKRARYPSSSSSPLSSTPPLVSSGSQSYHSGREESVRGNCSRGGHQQHHIAPHHQHPALSGSSSNTTTNHSSSGGYHHTGGLSSQAGTSHLSPPHTQYQPQHQQLSAAHYQHQQRYQGQLLQDDISGNNNTTTINKNTRNNNSDSSSSSSVQHQTQSGYQGASTSTPSSRRRRPSSSSSNSPPAPHDLPAPPPQPSSSSSSSSSHLQYPQHFMKGSIIQLANGSLKRVEDLQTEDFVSSAQISSDLKVDSSTVVRIEEHLDRGTAMLSFSVGEHRVQVTVEATLEHPFFVFGQGWSSCSVSRTLARYGLDCQKLNVGDVCISLTHKDVSLNAADISQQQQQQQQQHNNNGDNKQGPWDLKQTGGDGSGRTVPALSSTHTTSSCVLSTSSPPGSPSSSQPKPSAATSPLKIDTKTSLTHDLPVLPPPSSSPSSSSSNKRHHHQQQQQQQHELPPPMSNFVPVKKESSTAGLREHHHHHHHSRRRNVATSASGASSTSAAWQRTGTELSSVECKEELDSSVSGVGRAGEDESGENMSRKRRWSAPDPGLVKVEKERERERQHLADKAQRLEEMADFDSTATGRSGEEAAVSEPSPSVSPPPSAQPSTAK
ncbi:ataxin-1 [Elysia marginata]|uniref:Ataxin-1 n=1 Tax=Elysia marginata TaxID=1093978 RepID=A0AAV4JTZ3_9GAST|nr:ataxin-1 [Elysia marginata]